MRCFVCREGASFPKQWRIDEEVKDRTAPRLLSNGALTEGVKGWVLYSVELMSEGRIKYGVRTGSIEFATRYKHES